MSMWDVFDRDFWRTAVDPPVKPEHDAGGGVARNVFSPGAYADLLDRPPSREAALKALTAHLGGLDRKCFTLREGSLVVEVPLSVALDHVDPRLIDDMAYRMHCYAALAVRALATLPAATVRAWLDGLGHDAPGELVELLPDGGIRRVDAGFLCDDVNAQPVEEGRSAGALGGDAARHLADDNEQAVAERGLLRRQPSSLIHPDLPSILHPDPIVPRRERPPP
ncbi:hypothetical protein [Xanthobacter tagetidis]|uniref:Uncharacterized protein n=1 Tax=Xanthobacter tagetidis TaxID=60216 RepID=A0A3L7AKN7_9HYPH|nr:hypothetical protein [Xanthobacter tagetidis]MBB6308936.1 hypothetical protein [Xanthobacter tagetidis]RLP80555.1 hypothetical protein D9R14_05770 [Xanthobacter tagetidis]